MDFAAYSLFQARRFHTRVDSTSKLYVTAFVTDCNTQFASSNNAGPHTFTHQEAVPL